MNFVKAWRMFWGATGAACEQVAMACWEIEELFDEEGQEHTSGADPDPVHAAFHYHRT